MPSAFVADLPAISPRRAGCGGSDRGVPGFSAVDEDESESGVFSDKDFRNMSLKVCVCVRQTDRWTDKERAGVTREVSGEASDTFVFFVVILSASAASWFNPVFSLLVLKPIFVPFTFSWL